MHEARLILRKNTGWPGLLFHCALLVAATRLALFAIGSVARDRSGLPASWSDVWMHWDAAWYLDIAAKGYSQSPLLSDPLIGAGNLAFFPAFPMLLRFFGLFFPVGPVLATIVSTTCLVFAAALVHRTAEERYGGGAGLWAAVILTTVPGSFVFTSAMTESLYLLTTAAAFHFAHNRRFASAAISVAIAGVTRPLGVLLAPCLALDELLQTRFRSPGPPSWRAIALFAAAPLLLLLHMFHLWYAFGDAFAFMDIQTLWWHQFRNPLAILWEGLGTGWSLNIGVTLVGLAGLGLVLAGAHWLSAGELFFATANLVVPLFSTSTSMPRFVIAQFPVYLLLGLAASRSAPIRMALVPALAIGDLVVMAYWSIGREIFI